MCAPVFHLRNLPQLALLRSRFTDLFPLNLSHIYIALPLFDSEHAP